MHSQIRPFLQTVINKYFLALSRIREKKFLLAGTLILAALITWQQFSLGKYNNFQIFISSFPHLLEGKDLYLFYPDQYLDVFLYNPSFAVLFAPFSYLPIWLGMFILASGSFLIYLYALGKLPVTNPARLFIFIFCLPDCINSLQHQQLNHINLAFMLLAFIMMLNNKQMQAALFTTILIFLKVYPAAIGLCFLFFPNKIKFLGWCIAWAAVLFILPAIFVGFDGLVMQYKNWFASLGADRTIEEFSTALSLISINYQWLKNPLNPLAIQVTGLVLTLLPLLIKRKYFNNLTWQLTYLSAILLFIIVFNHAAESATYMLAVFGVALWYSVNVKTKLNTLILVLLVPY